VKFLYEIPLLPNLLKRLKVLKVSSFLLEGGEK
jgi:hypothetical protein